ncbi:ABC transporter substrate-binding protein [Oscillatoria sp. FACHB-1407]|uniref:ABC transporter substrate-binding protein n=1 Tax=Oscillatoria sp. FACHB-1407 TaxID=2692847 RepID=UPI001687D98B|nr:ABC transporter substrate-binding protein [Oscillatoria sp. FACHB-1407]MBD2460675.1 ABC transporter substrate-binding protein [Oscillatoria sp. FACHB-1407]
MLRQLKRWRTALLVLVAAMTVVLTNCGAPPATDNASSPTGSPAAAGDQTALVFGLGGQPANLEPGNIEDGNSIYAQQQIYNRLIDNAPGSTDLVPSLATEWTASEDGRTWTFKLREGVQFHDGTDFNAEAVKYNVERWWDPNHPEGYRNAGRTYTVWQSLFGGYKGDEASALSAVNVVDDYTVEFVFNEPFAAFPAAISSGYFGIASPTAIQEAGTDYGISGSVAVGTGPYVLQEWISGDRIVLQKNPNYWEQGLPKEEQLVFRFISEPAARVAELRSGSIDFTIDLAPDQLNELKSDTNLATVYRPSFNVGYLGLNTSYEPLSKVEVRQAIAKAINRPEIVQAFWGELGKVDSHFIPESLADFRAKDLGDYEYNPEQAKQMLADAGYPNGFDLELWYMPVSRPYFPTPKPIAEAFAADLSAIGIRVKLNTKDWAAYLDDRNKEPGYQAFMLGWTGDYGDPDNFYYAHFGPGATRDIGSWQDSKVFQLLNDARKVGDEAERIPLYAEVDKILFEQALRIPIVHSQPLNAARSNINGWEPSPLGSESFEQVEKT